MLITLNSPGLVALGVLLGIAGMIALLAWLVHDEKIWLALPLLGSALLFLALASVLIFSLQEVSTCSTPNVPVQARRRVSADVAWNRGLGIGFSLFAIA